MLKSILTLITDLLADILNWLQRAWKRLVSFVRLATPEPSASPIKSTARKVPKISALSRSIWVECASCGLVHELEAVCHVCGVPLCDDTRYCRKSIQVPELGQNAVACPEHAGG